MIGALLILLGRAKRQPDYGTELAGDPLLYLTGRYQTEYELRKKAERELYETDKAALSVIEQWGREAVQLYLDRKQRRVTRSATESSITSER